MTDSARTPHATWEPARAGRPLARFAPFASSPGGGSVPKDARGALAARRELLLTRAERADRAPRAALAKRFSPVQGSGPYVGESAPEGGGPW